MTKPYWCFICEKQFTAQIKEMGECPFCHEQAFQEVTPDNHPQQYEVYQRAHRRAQPPPSQNTSQAQTPNVHLRFSSMNSTPNDFNFIFSGILNSLPTIMNESMRILNSLMRNLEESGQRYRRASQAQIEALEKIQRSVDCSICQSDQIDGHNESYRLRCGHQFHIVCIQPWFQKADTCPTCRTKLTAPPNEN